MLKTGKLVLAEKGHPIFQRRYLITFLAFLCGVVMQSQRINISFALVAMVNSSNAHRNLVNQTAVDCGSPVHETEYTSTKTPEFTWSPETQGYILSAGYVGYILTQFPGGYVVRRYGVKLTLFVCFLSSSLCNLVSPAAARIHPYLLAAVHLARGMFQGPPTAAFALLSARWFPIQERGFLQCFLYIGYPIGGCIGSVISGPITELRIDGGWPLVFYTFGILGSLISILVFCLYAETPENDPKISERELQYIQENTKSDASEKQPPVPWKAILTSTSTYAFFIALFGQTWTLFYLLTIHPIYLDTILHLPVKENGLLTSGPQLIQAMSSFLTCWLSIWFKHKNLLSISLMRKGYNTIACVLYVLGILGLYLSGCDITSNEIFLFVVAGSTGISFAGCLIVAPDMTPTFCGLLMGLASTIASTAGFILPVLIGQLTKEEQTMVQWHKMFLITASVAFVAGVTFLLFGDVRIQPYDPAYTKNEASSKQEKTINKGN